MDPELIVVGSTVRGKPIKRRRCTRCGEPGDDLHAGNTRQVCQRCQARAISEAALIKQGLPPDALRKVNKDGYAFVRVDTDSPWIPEHRKVMEEKLGRSMLPHESVHHKNGIRDDNQPENLELWLDGIRRGQRAREIVCPHCRVPYLDDSPVSEPEPVPVKEESKVVEKKIRRRKGRPRRGSEEMLKDAPRFVRNMGKWIQNPEHLALLRQGVRQALDEAEAIGAAQLRANGYTDGEIGRSLGVTRWAVARRWPRIRKEG